MGSPLLSTEEALLANVQGRQLSFVLVNNVFYYQNFLMRWAMKRLTDLEYLKLSKFNAFLYKLKLFLCAIPGWLKGIGLAIVKFFVDFGAFILTIIKCIIST